MNLAQMKCLAVLLAFAAIGFGPVSLTCLLGFYVVLAKPGWFWALLTQVYAGLPVTRVAVEKTRGHPRLTCVLGLLVLFIADIAPVPVTSPIAAVIVLTRPAWFYRLAAGVYG